MKTITIGKSYTNREPISLYLKDIRKYPLLTAEEEKEVALKAKEGDPSAIRKLCESNLRFVISVAKQYQGQGLELPDLISEGNYGLIRAIKKFDPEKGFKFISYAVWWIRQAIIYAIQNTARPIRLPVGQVLNLGKINNLSKKFEQENGRAPTLQELSELTGLTEERISQLLEYNSKVTSLDMSLGTDEDSGTIIDIIPNSNSDIADVDLIKNNKQELISKALDKLSPRDHDILTLAFGLDTFPLDNGRIGELLGVTGERIRQIKDKLLKKLATSKGLKTLYYGS